MNKYKSALSDILCYVPFGKFEEQEKILQELVEKETPKKPTMIVPQTSCKRPRPYCADCGLRLKKSWIACPRCGRYIDWSEDDD